MFMLQLFGLKTPDHTNKRVKRLMERRRRAFGLKNVGNQKEKPVAVASTSADSAGSPTSSLKSAKPGAEN